MKSLKNPAVNDSAQQVTRLIYHKMSASICRLNFLQLYAWRHLRATNLGDKIGFPLTEGVELLAVPEHGVFHRCQSFCRRS